MINQPLSSNNQSKILIFALLLAPSEKDFSPKEGDYEMFIQALREEIAQLEGILQATQDNDCLYIETEEPLDEDGLKKRIKHLFTETMIQNLRYVSLDRIHD